MAVRHKRTSTKIGDENQTWRRDLVNYISRRMQATKTPALSIALLGKNGIVYSNGFGLRDMEKMYPADSNTLYGVGSVTKSFTALAIMQLQGRGLLDVHDKIEKHLPEFGPDSVLRHTEIHHLLNHSSGFPTLNVAEVTLMREFGNDTSFIPMSDFDDFVDIIEAAGDERVAQPGKKFMYWNEGYTILGRIIEKVSGEEYSEYVKKHILEPLGMNRSGFGPELTAGDENGATFYDRAPDARHKPKVLKGHELDVAAGGLISSAVELCHYIQMMLSGGALGSKKIISDKLLAEMTKPTIDSEQPTEFGGAHYGYGWSTVDNFFGHKMVSHSGDVGVSSAYVGYVPDLKIGVAVACNVGDGPSSSIGVYALACLMGKNAEKDVQTVVAQNLAEKLTGEFKDYRDFTTLSISAWGPGYLKAEFKSNEMNYSMPILFDGGKLYTVNNYRRFPIFHRTLPDGRVELLFERHRFVKK